MSFFKKEEKEPFDYSRFRTYKVQKGDTLHSVAQKLEITPFRLRRYHNSFCPKEDLIEDDFKSYLKILLLAPEKSQETTEEKEPIKTPFKGQYYILPFRPNALNTDYSVVYTTQKEDKIHTLEQNFRIKRLKPEVDQDEYFFFEINTISKLLINGEKPATRAYKLAEETANLYPLRLVTDIKGKWVEINSYTRISESWESKKTEIQKANNTSAIDEALNIIEQKVEDKQALQDSVASNWFLRAFFNGIHVAYTQDLEYQKSLFFPAIAQMEDLEFKITAKVNQYLDDLNQIVVTQTGELIDEYSEGYYDATYFLNPNSYSIEHLILECNLVDANQRITIMVTNLDKSKITIDSGVSLLV